jgi:TPP-dependent pyruvate/acetoin dehydrogenase alpha subunit
MNLAALWQLPVLFCCENNLYAMGTALERSESETDIALKASAYEMAAWPVDGMDVVAVEQAARDAGDAVRNGGGPHLLELRTYRFRAHSMYDPELYRSNDEVETWKRRDPIPAFVERCRAADLITDEDVEALQTDVVAEIDDAVAFAESGTAESIEDLTRFVHSEVSTR